MTEAQEVDTRLVEDANRRYWSSDASVNQIAEEMGLSKSSLYGMIEQLHSGLACPECSSELVFPNRTARDRQLVNCPACGFEGSAEEATEPAEQRHPAQEGRAALPASTRVVAGTALLGLAAGIVIGAAFRRR
jgi:predicted RNA-binding Zn-ribbon protein involved in translation (DUF1610 family)